MIADSDLPTISAALATVVAALAGAAATVIGYYAMRSNVDPHVIVYVTDDTKQPSLLLLVIENVGKGIAYDVRFASSKPLPERAYGISAESAPTPQPMTEGPLLTGIPAFPPGAKRIINWGQWGGLLKYLGEDTITVTVTYRSDQMGPFDRSEHQTVSLIEIQSFKGTRASDVNYERVIADQLKDIRRDIHRAVGLDGSLRVRLEIPKRDE